MITKALVINKFKIVIDQVVKGAAGVVGDAITFKWAQASMGQVAVNTVVVAEVSLIYFRKFSFIIEYLDCLLVLHWRMYW